MKSPTIKNEEPTIRHHHSRPHFIFIPVGINPPKPVSVPIKS
jgi:hypothetical protein